MKILLAASLFPVAGGIIEFAAYLVLYPVIWSLLITILIPFFVTSADHGASAGIFMIQHMVGLALPLALIAGTFRGAGIAAVTGGVMIMLSPIMRSNLLHGITAAIVGAMCSVFLIGFDLDNSSIAPALAVSGALAALASGSLGRRARRCLKGAVGAGEPVAPSGSPTAK